MVESDLYHFACLRGVYVQYITVYNACWVAGLHIICLPGQTHSTIIRLVVHPSEVQSELINLLGDGYACNSGSGVFRGGGHRAMTPFGLFVP